MDAQTFYKQTANSIAAYLMQELKLVPNTHYRIRSATSGPRCLTLVVNVNPRYAKQIMGMSEALSMAAMLDKNASIRVSRGNRGTLCLEIPKPESLWYNVSINSLPRRRGLLASVGLDGEHRPTAINFADSLTPHAMAAGSTGSGKTNIQRLLVYDLASQNEPNQVGFVLVDTQKRGKWWKDFANIPHLLHPVVTTEGEALRVLMWAAAEVDRRAERNQTKPHVFVCIDEVQSILDNEAVAKSLRILTAVGREYGLHCVLGLQNPTAEMMGGTADLKRNIVTRLVGKVDSGVAAYAATGQKNSGAEGLVGCGDFLFIEPRGTKRLTAALLTSKDTEHLPCTESIPSLDLSSYEDIDRVVEQASRGRGREPEPLEPTHVALAMTANRGITWLAQTLSIGSGRAKKVLEFARDLHSELSELGYTIIPHTGSIPIGGRVATE